jgi:hypothetical protein
MGSGFMRGNLLQKGLMKDYIILDMQRQQGRSRGGKVVEKCLGM